MSKPKPREKDKQWQDMHPPLSHSEALIEADRCYFCYDAPCTQACPTDIDIPGFIQQIRSNNLKGSARTILEQNIMGGMCARVCPTEVLCEQDCVRNTHEDLPVRIGLLQRRATDYVQTRDIQLFHRAAETGKRVAVVGAGPAGISCAHRLAVLGHDVVVFEAREKSGGLNEYGIAAYKTIDNYAQKELEYILSIGGITIKHNTMLGRDISLSQLSEDYDGVFLGIGLNSVNELGLADEDIIGVEDAVEYIAKLRQTEDLSKFPVADNIVVVGGGMTAIDVAVQTKKLGAKSVTIAYRRGHSDMNASAYEQEFAQTNGVVIRHWLSPKRILSDNGRLTGVEMDQTEKNSDGKLVLTGNSELLPCEVLFKAIGQQISWDNLGQTKTQLETQDNRIVVDANRKTSLSNVWAGGDCIVGGEDLTVSAVQDGKLAAKNIHHYLNS